MSDKPRPKRAIMTVTLPRCPACASPRLKVTNTIKSEAGIRRYAFCRGCGKRLLIYVQ